jgi:hypothetical protein
LCKVFIFARIELYGGVSLTLSSFSFMQDFIVELILIINYEMVCAVGKWDNRSVWQTPTKAASHSYSKT